jgi:phytoene/squalene synthetase
MLQAQPHEVAETIASKDGNNLYVTSSFFSEPEKYRAFCAYYAIMRVVDDRIDNLPPLSSRCADLVKRELEIVAAWERVVRISCRGIHASESLLASCDHREAKALCQALVASYRIFPVPIGLWTNFFAAMRSDVVESEMSCWEDFLSYAEGATVAPTTIYLSLIASRRDVVAGSVILPRDFELYDCGRHLGLFAYLVHIIRDLAEDAAHTATRLCLAREDMKAHGVSAELLKSEALRRQASPATRHLVGELLERAAWHLTEGRALVAPIESSLDRDCRFILELIITMYEHMLAKIEACSFDPMSDRHRIGRQEQVGIVREVAARTDFRLPNWATLPVSPVADRRQEER